MQIKLSEELHKALMERAAVTGMPATGVARMLLVQGLGLLPGAADFGDGRTKERRAADRVHSTTQTDNTWAHGCDACDAKDPVEYVPPHGYLCAACRAKEPKAWWDK